MEIKVYSATHVGMVRSCNQDSMASGLFDDGAAWAVVCDGMGGANGGEYASAKAIETISEVLDKKYTPAIRGGKIHTLLQNAILTANIDVYNAALKDTSLYGMGTTVVSAIIKDGSAYTAHAGDSRIYLISEDSIRQITRDHSMVQEMVDLGQITPDEARNHPRKNVITRALGVRKGLDIDFGECEFAPGDILLLCSDGLTNYVEDSELLAIARSSEPESIPQRYIDAACHGGGGDNITAVVLCG